jgi:hypothetical protein
MPGSSVKKVNTIRAVASRLPATGTAAALANRVSASGTT